MRTLHRARMRTTRTLRALHRPSPSYRAWAAGLVRSVPSSQLHRCSVPYGSTASSKSGTYSFSRRGGSTRQHGTARRCTLPSREARSSSMMTTGGAWHSADLAGCPGQPRAAADLRCHSCPRAATPRSPPSERATVKWATAFPGSKASPPWLAIGWSVDRWHRGEAALTRGRHASRPRLGRGHHATGTASPYDPSHLSLCMAWRLVFGFSCHLFDAECYVRRSCSPSLFTRRGRSIGHSWRIPSLLISV